MKKHGTLSEVINQLRLEEGYEADFNLLDKILKTEPERDEFMNQEFIVDEVFRFEGNSNPDDEAILYAVSTSSGQKGVLVDGYDYSSGQVPEQLLDKLDLKKHRPIN